MTTEENPWSVIKKLSDSYDVQKFCITGRMIPLKPVPKKPWYKFWEETHTPHSEDFSLNVWARTKSQVYRGLRKYCETYQMKPEVMTIDVGFRLGAPEFDINALEIIHSYPQGERC